MSDFDIRYCFNSERIWGCSVKSKLLTDLQLNRLERFAANQLQELFHFINGLEDET